MRNFSYRRKWLTGLIIGLCLLIHNPAIAATVFRITTWEWPPLISKDLKGGGPLCRLVTHAFALEGIKVEFGFYPWKRAMAYAVNGEWDGTIIWTYTKQRDKVLGYSDFIFQEGMHFFHLKSYAFNWESLDNLKGIKIGATLGYNYGTSFHEADAAKFIDVGWVHSDKLNFIKLLSGRIDIFPVELGAGYACAQKHLGEVNTLKVTHHAKALKIDTYHLLFSRKIQHFESMREQFNSGLQKLKDSGQLTRYLTKQPDL